MEKPSGMLFSSIWMGLWETGVLSERPKKVFSSRSDVQDAIFWAVEVNTLSLFGHIAPKFKIGIFKNAQKSRLPAFENLSV